MPNVLWRSLKLTGFGPFQETTTVSFDAALNFFVAPNEWGKSTLAAGIAAVLFGLPATSDKTQWGTARYRNREGTHFTGELRFSIDAREYLLRRDFARGTVKLWQIDNSGELNSLPPALQDDILGITQDDYLIINPLNQEIMRSDLESYIVSVFESITQDYQQTLTALKQQINRLSSNGEHGTGMLEQVRSRLRELKTELKQAIQLRDALTQARQKLHAVNVQFTAVTDKLKTCSYQLELIDSWLKTNTEYQRTNEHYSTLENMYREACRLTAVMQDCQEQSREYSEFCNVPKEQAEVLDQLLELDTESQEISALKQELSAQIQKTNQQLQDTQAYIESNLRVFARYPDTVAKHARLQELVNTRNQLRQQIERYQSQLKQLKQQLGELPEYHLLGPSPRAMLSVVKDTVRQTVSAYRRLEALWQRKSQLENQLQEYRLFTELDPELLELAATFRQQKSSLARQFESAKMAWSRAQEKIKAFGARQLEVMQEYEDIAHVAAESSATIAEKLDLESKLKQLEHDLEQRQQQTRPARWQYLIALLFSCGAGAALWLKWGRSAGLLGSLASLGTGLAAALILTLAIRTAHKRDAAAQELRSQIEQLSQRLRIVNLQLGDLVQLSLEELQQLLWRVKQREAALRELFAIKQELPAESQLAALKSALTRAESAYQGFMEAAAALTCVFEDPQQAYEYWRKLESQLNETAALYDELSADEFDQTTSAHPGSVELERLAGKWSTLISLAAAHGKHCRTCGELLAWMSKLDEQWWQNCQQTVETWESLRDKKAEVEQSLRQLLEVDPSGQSRCERLTSEITQLSEALKPISHDTPHQKVLALEHDYLTRKQLLEQLEAQKERLAQELRQLESRASKISDLLRTKSRSVAAILQYNNSDIARSAKRWHEFERLTAQYCQVKQQLAALLSAGSFSSTEQLKQRLEQLKSHQSQLHRNLNQLVDQLKELGLAEPTAEILEQRRQELCRKLPELNEALAALEQQRQQLSEKVTRLEARQTADITQVENQVKLLSIKEQEILSELRELTSRYKTIEERAHNLLQDLSQKLSLQLTKHLQVFTDSQRTVTVDDNLAVSIEATGLLVPAQLSSGTREQLILALRMALSDLVEHNTTLPLILDDCFVHSDEERMHRVYAQLKAISRHRQIIVFSSQHPPKDCPYVKLKTG